jgi:hypothetical protein
MGIGVAMMIDHYHDTGVHAQNDSRPARESVHLRGGVRRLANYCS